MELHLIPRLFVTSNLALGQNIVLGEDQSHYVARVMRLGIGKYLRLFNGHDGEWLGTISVISKRSLEIKLKEQSRPQVKEAHLLLFCAPIRKAHFEYMIEKSTELGVSVIQPILTSRTQIRDVNTERCRSIAIEAAEQSERLSIPSIGRATELNKCLRDLQQDCTPLICAERGDAQPVHAIFSSLPKLHKIAIFVGPEGGFSAEEFEMLRALPQAKFAKLGPRILRADTAAIASLSCWQAICGDWVN